MVTYYAAMGKYQLEQIPGGNRPVVILAGQEYGVTVCEYLVWNALLWNILDYEALKAACLHNARQFHIALSDADFDQTLDRLLLRELVIQGQGFTGLSALYNLLDGVCLVPVRFSLFRRIAGFFQLLVEGYPFRLARHIFGPDRLSSEEKAILKTLPADGVARQIRFSPFSDRTQLILAAVTGLYLKRMVIFENSKQSDKNVNYRY